ncbi:MAG: CvpA family protein [Spirochaetales bacterium]|nr:CvpA family protein [Spirochaetales bacterium]
MTFTVVDYVICGIIVLFALIGLIKGFLDSIFGILCWVAGLLLGCIFYKAVSIKYFSAIKNVMLSDILAFLAIFIAVFLVLKIIQTVISKLFQFKILNSLDKTLGVFFGIFEGFALCWILIVFLETQPFFKIENLFENSYFYNLIHNFIKNTDFTQMKTA